MEHSLHRSLVEVSFPLALMDPGNTEQAPGSALLSQPYLGHPQLWACVTETGSLVHQGHQVVKGEQDWHNSGSHFLNHAYFSCCLPQQLKLHGVEIPEGTHDEMDKQFLMEIMEINETLAEAPNEAVLKEIESIVRGKTYGTTNCLSLLLRGWG